MKSPRGPLRRRPFATERSGFTLAEILVTLLIMAGVMVSITQVLQTARMSRDTIHNLRENQLAGPAIMDMLERDLRGLLTYSRTRQDHIRIENRVMLGLDGDSIDFATTTTNLIGRIDGDRYLTSSVNEVGYRLRPRPDADDFLEIYRREDMGIDEEPFGGGEYAFLHDRVKSFDIQVFSEDGLDAEPLESWGLEGDENIGLPARLEITLVLENAARVSREQWLPDSAQRRTVAYRRVIRPREDLRVEESGIVIAAIPEPPSNTPEPGGGGGGGGDDPLDGADDGSGDIFGDDLPGSTGGGGNGRTSGSKPELPK
jgi:prepilin-type N-terminal cleavage/methylation domain-containing protein